MFEIFFIFLLLWSQRRFQSLFNKDIEVSQKTHSKRLHRAPHSKKSRIHHKIFEIHTVLHNKETPYFYNIFLPDHQKKLNIYFRSIFISKYDEHLIFLSSTISFIIWYRKMKNKQQIWVSLLVAQLNSNMYLHKK